MPLMRPFQEKETTFYEHGLIIRAESVVSIAHFAGITARKHIDAPAVAGSAAAVERHGTTGSCGGYTHHSKIWNQPNTLHR